MPKRRNDLQGLRALCIIEILIFHAWGLGTPVGVDVFVMLSAYLLAASYRRGVDRGTPQRLLDRWLHSFKRLLPPLVITVVVTLGLCALYLPPTRWRESVNQALASVGFVQNIYLGRAAVDYYADAGATTSPFMHLWYIAMQGQVLLLLPLLLAVAAWLTRTRRAAFPYVAAAILGVVAIASFAWTLAKVSEVGASGIYFDPRARAWEFAIGAMVGLVGHRLRMPAPLEAVAGWAALLTLTVFAAVTVRDYPGPLALITVAASLALLAWSPTLAWAPTRVLSLRPLVWIGDISYCLYLVHWPVLAIYQSARGIEHPGWVEGLLLLGVSVALAHTLTDLVDTPLRAWPWANRSLATKAVVVAACFALGFGVCGSGLYLLNRRQAAQAANERNLDEHPGALAAQARWQSRSYTAPAIPQPERLDGEWGTLPHTCSGRFATHHDTSKATAAQCVQLPWRDDATRTVVALGDSHMEQYIETIEPLARSKRWNLALQMYGACQYNLPEHSPQTPGCAEHNAYLESWVPNDVKPDVVILVSTRARVGGVDEEFTGLDEAVARFTDAGIRVVGLRDNPQYEDSMYDCALAQGVSSGDRAGCERPAADVLSPHMPDDSLRTNPLYRGIDTGAAICPDGTCWSIVGNVFVWRDHDHLTTSYATSLAKVLGGEIVAAVEGH